MATPRDMRSAPVLPADLEAAIERAGYYPALVADVVESALGPDTVVAHLVHQETTFDQDAVRRHITVLAMTPSRLVIVHADDHEGLPGTGGEGEPGPPVATATSETVPLTSVRGVMLTHVISSPDTYVAGSLGREITLTIGWGAVARIDIVPAACSDPDCDADHGFEGTVASDDISLRISSDADGDGALTDALSFARTLSGSIGGPVRS
ncbi:MAG: DUF5998 family protein [Lapillicoccus sp.]